MRLPQVGFYYYRKSWPNPGIYVVYYVDPLDIKLRLVSKPGQPRKFIKKSKMVVITDHSNFIQDFTDDVAELLSDEFEELVVSYSPLIGLDTMKQIISENENGTDNP